MARLPPRSQFLNETIARVIESETESDVSSENALSDDQDEGSSLQDSNDEDNNQSLSADTSSEKSDSDPPMRRRRLKSRPVEHLIARNGQKWSLIAPPAAQTVAANILTQRESLTAVGQSCSNMSHGFGFFVTKETRSE